MNQKKSKLKFQTYIIEQLECKDDFSMTAFELIQEFNIENAQPDLIKLLNSDNEIIICNALQTLKSINKLDGVDIKSISEKINNLNIKAVVESL